MKKNEAGLKWHGLARFVSNLIFERYIGLTLTEEVSKSCSVLFDCALSIDTGLNSLSKQQQQALTTAAANLKSAIQQAITSGSDSANTIVARLAELK